MCTEHNLHGDVCACAPADRDVYEHGPVISSDEFLAVAEFRDGHLFFNYGNHKTRSDNKDAVCGSLIVIKSDKNVKFFNYVSPRGGGCRPIVVTSILQLLLFDTV